MLIALSSTCIQTFSIRLASHADHLRGSSRAPDEPLRTWEASVRNAPALSAIRHVACKAPDDPFWAGMQELLRLSNNITFWIRQLKKNWSIYQRRLSYRPLFAVRLLYFLTNLPWRTERCLIDWAEVCFVLFCFLQTQGPPLFAVNQSVNSFESYSQKTREGFEQFGLQNTKIWSGKIYSHTRTSGAKVQTLNILVKRWHNKYKIFN